MTDLVYKTNEQASVEETKTETAASPWWQWTKDHVAYQIDVLHEAIGQVIAHERRAFRDELGLLKRELLLLREEVQIEKKLANLRADIPSIPDVEKRIADEQAATKKEVARLRRELAKAMNKISDLQVEASQAAYTLREMEKEKRDTRTLVAGAGAGAGARARSVAVRPPPYVGIRQWHDQR